METKLVAYDCLIDYIDPSRRTSTPLHHRNRNGTSTLMYKIKCCVKNDTNCYELIEIDTNITTKLYLHDSQKTWFLMSDDPIYENCKMSLKFEVIDTRIYANLYQEVIAGDTLYNIRLFVPRKKYKKD